MPVLTCLKTQKQTLPALACSFRLDSSDAVKVWCSGDLGLGCVGCAVRKARPVRTARLISETTGIMLLLLLLLL